jgi:TonB family protein
MKRSIFAATLLLTPALLHAQASAPAQTLQAHIAPVAAINAAASAAPAASAPAIRVSTGVVGPKLVHSVDLTSDGALHNHLTSNEVTVVVDMTVDENGKPENLVIGQSAGDVVDKAVLAAVSQYRFKPGTLDGQVTALPVALKVIIERGAQY